jgi:hypothetical protein
MPYKLKIDKMCLLKISFVQKCGDDSDDDDDDNNNNNNNNNNYNIY